jgi:hypothetical protein
MFDLVSKGFLLSLEYTFQWVQHLYVGYRHIVVEIFNNFGWNPKTQPTHLNSTPVNLEKIWGKGTNTGIWSMMGSISLDHPTIGLRANSPLLSSFPCSVVVLQLICVVLPPYWNICRCSLFFATLTTRLIQKNYWKYVNGKVKIKILTIIKYVANKIDGNCTVFE